ncbi:MAG: cytochrome c biogenesis protein CcsA [Syntrophaceae bacterium]
MMALMVLYSLTGLVFILYVFLRAPRLALAGRGLLAISALAHLCVIVLLGLKMRALPLTSLPQALNMMVLCATLIFIPLTLRRKTIALGAFYSPAAAFILALISPQAGLSRGVIPPSHLWYPLHTMAVILGESMFIVATVASAAYLIHEHLIRKGSIHAMGEDLPPLTILDKVLMHSMSTGFVAITLGMLFGGFWAAASGIALADIAVKIFSGAMTWAVFALGIHQRYALGWMGRRTALITVCGFGITVVAVVLFWGMYPYTPGPGMAP